MGHLARSIIPCMVALGAIIGVARAADDGAPIYCGGETTAAEVELYFLNLRNALAQDGPPSRFNAFVSERFGVRYKSKKTLYFKVQDFNSITPSRITVEEWSEISRRGAAALHSGGWRGCFMDDGKIWFEASEAEGFRLKLIARDMPWQVPEDKRAIQK